MHLRTFIPASYPSRMSDLITPFKMTLIRRITLPAILALSVCFLGCDSGPEPLSKKDVMATVELETGRFALQKMLAPSRFWAGDAQPVRMESTNLKDTNGHDGKAVFWRAMFASPGRQKAEA